MNLVPEQLATVLEYSHLTGTQNLHSDVTLFQFIKSTTLAMLEVETH